MAKKTAKTTEGKIFKDTIELTQEEYLLYFVDMLTIALDSVEELCDFEDDALDDELEKWKKEYNGDIDAAFEAVWDCSCADWFEDFWGLGFQCLYYMITQNVSKLTAYTSYPIYRDILEAIGIIERLQTKNEVIIHALDCYFYKKGLFGLREFYEIAKKNNYYHRLITVIEIIVGYCRVNGKKQKPESHKDFDFFTPVTFLVSQSDYNQTTEKARAINEGKGAPYFTPQGLAKLALIEAGDKGKKLSYSELEKVTGVKASTMKRKGSKTWAGVQSLKRGLDSKNAEISRNCKRSEEL